MKFVLGVYLLLVSGNLYATALSDSFVGSYKVAKCNLLPGETDVQIEKINNTLQILPVNNQALPVLKINLNDTDFLASSGQFIQVQEKLFSIVNNLLQDGILIGTQKIARSATGNRVRFKIQQFIANEELSAECLFYRK